MMHTMSCSHTASCPLYSLFKSQALLGVWKVTYCDTDQHRECARFVLTCEGRSVPPNLLPNGKLLNIPLKK
jgi:hypothetical protein